MRFTTVAFAFGFLLSNPAVAQDTATAQKEIGVLEAAIGEAMIHRDVATLSRIVADEWTAQNDSGVTATKTGFINDVKSGTLVVTAFRLHDVQITVLGDVAYVQGFDDEKSSYDGKDGSGTYNWLDVWVLRSGHWVSVASQLTKVSSTK